MLYQLIQRAVSHSTSRCDAQVRFGASMASVLSSPIVDSISALSSASPTVPMDPAIPASINSWVNASDVYCVPASE